MISSSPNRSTPQYVNGATSVHYSFVRSSFIWSPIFACNLWQIPHLYRRCWTITLAFTVHIYLCLRWFKVIPLASWATLWWLYWIVILETALFFGRMTEWFSSSVKFDFVNLPPTHKMTNTTTFWNYFLLWFQLFDFIGKLFILYQKEDFLFSSLNHPCVNNII